MMEMLYFLKFLILMSWCMQCTGRYPFMSPLRLWVGGTPTAWLHTT